MQSSGGLLSDRLLIKKISLIHLNEQNSSFLLLLLFHFSLCRSPGCLMLFVVLWISQPLVEFYLLLLITDSKDGLASTFLPLNQISEHRFNINMLWRLIRINSNNRIVLLGSTLA